MFQIDICTKGQRGAAFLGGSARYLVGEQHKRGRVALHARKNKRKHVSPIYASLVACREASKIVGKLFGRRARNQFKPHIIWSQDGQPLERRGDQQVRGWSAQAVGKKAVVYRGHAKGVPALAWSPEGTHIVSGDYAGFVNVWRVATGRTLFTYLGAY